MFKYSLSLRLTEVVVTQLSFRSFFSPLPPASSQLSCPCTQHCGCKNSPSHEHGPHTGAELSPLTPAAQWGSRECQGTPTPSMLPLCPHSSLPYRLQNIRSHRSGRSGTLHMNYSWNSSIASILTVGEYWSRSTALKAEEEPDVLSREASGQTDPEPCRSTRRKQWVTVMGESLLQGMDTPICQPNLLSRGVWCLPTVTLWVRIKEQTNMGDKVVRVC